MKYAYDYTTAINPAHIREAGVTQVFRYLSYPSASAKVIGVAEYRSLTAAGIDVILNWEYDAHDWLRGPAAGRADALMARQLAKELGYPRHWPIIGSCDFDMQASDWTMAHCAGYAKEFSMTVAEGGWMPGVYGPWDALVRCRDMFDVFWQAGMSTDWSNKRNKQLWPDAHWRQLGHAMVAGVDVDFSEILKPWKVVDVKFLACDNAGNYYICDLFASRWLPSGKAVADVLYLGNQIGGLKMGPTGTETVEWTSSGVRKGWNEAAFGTLVGPRPPSV